MKSLIVLGTSGSMRFNWGTDGTGRGGGGRWGTCTHAGKVFIMKQVISYRSTFFRLFSNVGEPTRRFVRLSRFGLYDGLTRPLLALSFGLRAVADRCGDLTDVLGLSGLLDLRLDSLFVASSTAESKTLYRKSYLC